MKLHFPQPFAHDHPPVQNVNDLVEGKLTLGQRAADGVAALMGSWTFILIQSGLLLTWVALNVIAYITHWDP